MNLAVIPPASTRHFLGVERSATGRAWRDRLDERASARALAIVQRHELPELLARVLAGRGVEVEDALAFLDPTVRTLLPDPDTLAGMAAAATRIADAVERGEKVAILGDYDVDGATLLITVDCGTTSHDALAEAARLGMQTIVIDHHLADEVLPPALAVINPN